MERVLERRLGRAMTVSEVRAMERRVASARPTTLTAAREVLRDLVFQFS